MKYAIVTIICSSLCFLQHDVQAQKPPLNKKYLLGVSGGLNNFVGLGISAGYIANQKHIISVGAGSGGYSAKIGLNYEYYLRNSITGWSFGLGYSFAPANSAIIRDTIFAGPISDPKPVLLQLQFKHAHLLNLQLKKTWRLYKNGRYYLCGGYARPLAPVYKEYSNPTETEGFAKNVLLIAAPGGLIIGGGLVFAIK